MAKRFKNLDDGGLDNGVGTPDYAAAPGSPAHFTTDDSADPTRFTSADPYAADGGPAQGGNYGAPQVEPDEDAFAGLDRIGDAPISAIPTGTAGDGIGSVSRADGTEAVSAHYQGKSKRGKGVKIALIVVLAVVAILGITGGVLAMRLSESAKTVKAEAKQVMADVSSIKGAIKETDANRLTEVAKSVEVGAHNIHDEVNTDLWNFAASLPVVGQDVKSAQVLADVLVDLSDNALTPLSGNADILNLKKIFHDGSVDIQALKSLSGAIEQAAPVLSRSADAIAVLPPARIGQVSEMLEKARDTIVTADEMMAEVQKILPLLPAMLGADGQTRNYLIIAQNNSELRSMGGLPGSWGLMSVTDGNISLGDFQSILHKPDLQVDSTEEERQFFATNFDTDPAQVNFVTQFPRVGEMSKQYWEQFVGDSVDGVVALDPVFLQHMLALTGGFETYDGTQINGENAAYELLSNVYWRYGSDNDAQDYFFAETAGLAAKTFFEHIGDAGLMKFYKALKADMESHRLLVWMQREEEQEIMRAFGADGSLSQDPTKPVLGVFVNDDTYSKISWYTDLDVSVGEPVRNSDGTTSYDVSVGLGNTISVEDSYDSPYYVSGYNSDKRSPADMIDYVIIHAPAGATISDMQADEAEFVSEGSVYGLQSFRSRVFTDGGQTSWYRFRVTVSAEATRALEVRTTPLAQEGNIHISYAEEPAKEEGSGLLGI